MPMPWLFVSKKYQYNDHEYIKTYSGPVTFTQVLKLRTSNCGPSHSRSWYNVTFLIQSLSKIRPIPDSYKKPIRRVEGTHKRSYRDLLGRRSSHTWNQNAGEKLREVHGYDWMSVYSIEDSRISWIERRKKRKCAHRYSSRDIHRTTAVYYSVAMERGGSASAKSVHVSKHVWHRSRIR